MITTVPSPLSTPPRKAHHAATLSAPLTPEALRQLTHFTQNVLSPNTNQRLQSQNTAINQQNATLTAQVTTQAAAIQALQTQMSQVQSTVQTVQGQLALTIKQRDSALLTAALVNVRVQQETALTEAATAKATTAAAAHQAEVNKHYDTQQALLKKHFDACAKIINEELQRTGWAKITGLVKDVKDVAGTAAIGFLAAGVPTGNAKAAGAGGVTGCMFGMVEKVVGSSWEFQLKTMTIAIEIYQASQVCKKNNLLWQPDNNFPIAGKEVFAWVKTIWPGDTFEARIIKKAMAGLDPREAVMERDTEEADTAAKKTAAQPSTDTAAATTLTESWWSAMTSVLKWS